MRELGFGVASMGKIFPGREVQVLRPGGKRKLVGLWRRRARTGECMEMGLEAWAGLIVQGAGLHSRYLQEGRYKAKV